MARDNETNTLELHIKVNGQNLSAISEKYNIGTLRIPSDPSWPKIPSRRSSNNTNDIIESPCVITLTGTPRKSRSIVQTVASQYLKSRLNQKYEATTHVAKKLPGYFDPRFKRQISRQKAEKPDEFCNIKDNKQTLELDSHISQEIKNLENKSRETGEIVDRYVPCHDVNNLLSSVGKSTKKTTDEQPILEATCCPSSNSLQHTIDERYDVKRDKFSKEEKQESNRPLLMDEKKLSNTLKVETASLPAQCYSVQIPAVACRDVPISNTQMEEALKMPSMCENNAVKETVGKFTYPVKDDNAAKPSININDKMLEKDIRSLSKDKAYSENNKEKECKREQRIKRNTNLSRKAKSFFRKRSRLAITDSDCTLILPGNRYFKGKRHVKIRDRFSKVSLPLDGRNEINSLDSILVKASKQDQMNSRLLASLRNSLEKPLSAETRELLNKSYWEYYWKVSAAGEREECSNYLPESQTLRQCSVLSCMINTALRDADGRSSSAPNVTCENVSGLPFVLAKKIKRTKRAYKWLLGLRGIALLLIATYVAAILFPTIYEYLFGEEYEEDEANYVELTLRYIAASFREALDGIIDVLTTIFLRPVRTKGQ